MGFNITLPCLHLLISTYQVCRPKLVYAWCHKYGLNIFQWLLGTEKWTAQWTPKSNNLQDLETNVNSLYEIREDAFQLWGWEERNPYESPIKLTYDALTCSVCKLVTLVPVALGLAKMLRWKTEGKGDERRMNKKLGGQKSYSSPFTFQREEK